MATIPKNPTLKDLQTYAKIRSEERGWTKDTYAEKFLLLVEEVGELAKAIRAKEGLYTEKKKFKKEFLAEEIADVFSYIVTIANFYNVDLEAEFRKKEKKNENRHWD